MKIWLNGSFVSASGAIDAGDRGMLLGDGVFETLAILGGRPLRFARHLSRLTDGAAMLGMDLPTTAGEIGAAIRALAESAEIEEGSARITLTRGPAPRGVLPPPVPTPTLLVTVARGAVGDTAAISAIVAASTRRNDCSPLAAVKSTNYLDAILARREADDAGAHEAIMLNTRGRVAEATAANVFCVIGGEVVTPPVMDGALPGTMRACVMEAERVAERSLWVDDLRAATEIVLTSSLAVRPVTMLDGAPVGDGKPGPVAQRLGTLPRTAD